MPDASRIVAAINLRVRQLEAQGITGIALANHMTGHMRDLHSIYNTASDRTLRDLCGFAHAFRPLSQEETRFVLAQHWQGDEFADQEAVAAILTITAGNLRLIDRLMAEVRRIKEINRLGTVTREVVDAARDCLVIGTA